nr:hypothetical protein [uncultured Rhodopila sp.]
MRQNIEIANVMTPPANLARAFEAGKALIARVRSDTPMRFGSDVARAAIRQPLEIT